MTFTVGGVDVAAVRVGATQAVAVYLGDEKVWPPQPLAAHVELTFLGINKYDPSAGGFGIWHTPTRMYLSDVLADGTTPSIALTTGADLSIYDVADQLIYTLHINYASQRPSGAWEVRWTGSSLISPPAVGTVWKFQQV